VEILGGLLINRWCVGTSMPKRGSPEHEGMINKYLQELEADGFRVLNLDNKSPDGIAVKGNKIFAVEVLRKIKTERKNWFSIKNHGRYVWKFQSGHTKKKKLEAYKMFDGVLISTYKAPENEQKV